MKRVLACVFALLLGCVSLASAGTPPQKMDGLVCLTVLEDNLPLRYVPDSKGSENSLFPASQYARHTVNSRARLWAEKWPVINDMDKTSWYRVLFAVDAGTGRCMTASPARYSLYEPFLAVYVPVEAVKAEPLTAEEQAMLADTLYGKAFAAFDMSPEGQQRYMGGDYHVFHVSELCGSGNEAPDAASAVHELPSNFWELPFALLGGTTDKQGARWYHLLDQTNFCDFWMRKENVKLRGGHPLSAGQLVKLMDLYTGGNLNDMHRRWNLTGVERSYYPDVSDMWGMVVQRNSVKAEGMEYRVGMGSWMLKLDRAGASFLNLTIGQSVRADVEKLMGKPVTVRHDAGEACIRVNFLPEGVDSEVWWYHDKGEFFEQAAFSFGPDGKLNCILLEAWRAE